MLKAKIISAIAAVVLAGAFLTALALSDSDTPAYSTPPGIEPPPIPSVTEEEYARFEFGFWVSEFDGYAAVFHNADRGVPIETTLIALRSLRTADQDMLKTGVFFEDYMDVVMFLEDFGP
jgi:hypothetical protein